MISIITDFDLTGANTFRIAAKCREFIVFTEPNDLDVLFASRSDRRMMTIGSGSNLLFVNDYIDSSIAHSAILTLDIDADNDCYHVRAGSGIVMDELVRHLAEAGIWGLENLSGIPGTVGASAVQNVGAYGVEAGQFIERVHCYDVQDRKHCVLTHDECEFAYRNSFFKKPENKCRFIITSVDYCLPRNLGANLTYKALCNSLLDVSEELTPMLIREAVIKIRNSKLPDPMVVGSAGSYFKNPVITKEKCDVLIERFPELVEKIHSVGNDCLKIPAAWLIDKSDLKNVSVGGAGLWTGQPLVIVNKSGNATSDDILGMERKVQDAVKNNFGILLQPEVEHVG